MNRQEKAIAISGGYVCEGGEYQFRTSLTPEPKLFLLAIAIIAVVIWFCVQRGVGSFWIVLLCLGIFIVGLTVQNRFTVEPMRKIIRKQTLLLGRRLIKEQPVSLSEFDQVLVEQDNASGEESPVFRVSLRHISGRKLFLKYFHTPRPAEELAWRVSCDTGILLKGESV